MALSLVRVDGDYNILGEIESAPNLPAAIARLRQLEAAGESVDLIDDDTAQFVPVPAWVGLWPARLGFDAAIQAVTA